MQVYNTLLLASITLSILYAGNGRPEVALRAAHQAARRLSAEALSDSSSAEYDATVIVVGAGVAGLGAARQLADQGISVLVLEGRNRTGGRMNSMQTPSGYVLDFGCSWIHGINGSSDGKVASNPIWDIAQQAGAVTGTTGSPDDNYVARGIMVNISTASALFDDFLANLTATAEQQPGTSVGLSVEDVRDDFVAATPELQHDQAVRDAFEALVFSEYQENEAADAKNISADFQGDTNHFYGPEVVFKNGYRQISNFLARDLNIELSANVTVIAHNNDTGVTVSTADGREFRSDYVIVTVPLGVLKRNGISFVPPLPAWKQQAINKIGWGLMDKTFFVFDTPFWEVDDTYVIMRVSPVMGEWVYWFNVAKVFGSPILMCLHAGTGAEKLQKLPDDQVFAEGLAVLREMYGNSTVPEPKAAYRTNWGIDPFAWGAYSFTAVGQENSEFDELSLPVDGRVLWAGEATSADYFGYTHGALMSGRREAARLLFEYELLPAYDGTGNAAAAGMSAGNAAPPMPSI